MRKSPQPSLPLGTCWRHLPKALAEGIRQRHLPKARAEGTAKGKRTYVNVDDAGNVVDAGSVNVGNA